MKLQPPLSNIVDRCRTICVPECCGIDAYDFSPIQIASHLTMWRGLPEENEVEAILSQLAALKRQPGASGITIEEMNQKFTPGKIDDFVSEISANLKVALDLVKQSEAQRWRRASR